MLPLPIWPPATNKFFDNAKMVFDAFRPYLPIPGSLGMVAQAEAESAFKITAVGDRGAAFALFQWHGTRIAAIKKATGIDIAAFPPIAEQCQGAIWELQTIKSLGLAQLLAAKTAMEAGIAGCQYFERAGQADAAERRGAMAERWSTYAAQHGWTAETASAMRWLVRSARILFGFAVLAVMCIPLALLLLAFGAVAIGAWR